MKSEKKAEKDWSAVEVMQEVNEKLSSYVDALEQRNRKLERLVDLEHCFNRALPLKKPAPHRPDGA